MSTPELARPRVAVPLTPCRGARPDAALAERVDAVVAELRCATELGLAEDGGRPLPAGGLGTGIHVEDLSSMPLVGGLPGAAGLQLRARLRAAAGDVVLSNVPVPCGYEEYSAVRLGLGAVRWLRAAASDAGLACSAWRDRGCFDALAALARRGPCYLHPYLAANDVWQLAARLSEAAGRPVPVLGPPPRLCALANNKIFFARLVGGLLGPEAVVEQREAACLPELAQHLRELARSCARLCIQRPSCTSGLGNRWIEAREVAALDPPALDRRLGALLKELQWDGAEAVQVVRWEDGVVASPSMQLWIPPAGRGGVRCEGIFLQRFAAGHPGRFAGAVPAALPRALASRLRRESCAIGTVLQRLGYVGRCSLDALLLPAAREAGASAAPGARSAIAGGAAVAALGAAARIRYVDCNARWGAVSTPMTLLNRLHGDHRRLAYVIAEVAAPASEALGFPELLRLLDSELYCVGRRRGVLVVNAGRQPGDGKVAVVGVGSTQAEAEELVGDRVPRLLWRAGAGARRPRAAAALAIPGAAAC